MAGGREKWREAERVVRGRRGEEEKTFNNYLERFLGGGLAKSVIDASIGLLFVRLHCYRFTLVRMPLLFFPRLSSLIAVVFSCFLFFHLVFIPSNVLIFFHGLNVSVSVVFSVHLNTPSSAASRSFISALHLHVVLCVSPTPSPLCPLPPCLHQSVEVLDAGALLPATASLTDAVPPSHEIQNQIIPIS